MKLRTALSGLTAIMLVAVFYTFSFLIVEDVDDGVISIDYYFATEPEKENTGGESEDDDKLAAEAVYAFISGNGAQSELLTEEEPEPVNTAVPDSMPEQGAPVNPADETPLEDEPAEESEAEEVEDEELTDDFNSEEGSFAANAPDVLAEDEPADNRLLTRLEGVDSAVVTTLPEDLSDIPSVPLADVVVTFSDGGFTYNEPESPSANTANGAANSPTGEKMTVRYDGAVHTHDAYELICAIVNREVSDYFSDEAIKAQAVAAYSYVKYHNVNGLTPSVLVRWNPSQRIQDLVSEVFGVTCYYNGKVAQTVYMASSSGYTASSVNVWGGSIPYLVSVETPFDAQSDPNYGGVVSYTEKEVKYALENALGIKLSDDPSNWLKIAGYADGNYVSSLNVDGQVTITGRKMREQVMGYNLKSAAFNVVYHDGWFTFTTYGYGHGVGMSQNGANILAKQGYSYVDILKFYFTGIEVR